MDDARTPISTPKVPPAYPWTRREMNMKPATQSKRSLCLLLVMQIFLGTGTGLRAETNFAVGSQPPVVWTAERRALRAIRDACYLGIKVRLGRAARGEIGRRPL